MKNKKYIFISVIVAILVSVGFAYAIDLSSNFTLSAQLPLDNRIVATTTVARDNTPSIQRYDGMVVYVEADNKNYQLQGGITNSDWVEWTLTGGGGVGTSTNPFMASYFVATSTTATSSLDLLSVQTALNFFGTFADSLDDLCVAITGGAGLCDGIDASGSGGLATSTAIADTEIIYGTSISTVGSEPAFTYDDATDKLTVVNASTTALSVTGTGTSTFAGPITMQHPYYLTTHGVRGDASDGLYVLSNNYTPVANFGVGNTANSIFNGAVNIDGNTRLATSLTGVLQAISGAVTATSTISQAFIDSTIARDSELHSAVTLSGALDYITLVGQDIVRGAIDLTTDVTGILPIANGGTGASAFGANRLPYMNSGNTALTSTSTLVVTSDKNLGLGTTTPNNAIAIKRTNEDAAITLQVETTAGGVGGAAETATTSPGTAASGTGGSCNTSCAWSNISNILTSNDVYATNAADLFRDDFTDYALATNYGFAIPAGSTINGIVVGVEANEDLSDDFIDHSVRLIIGGVLSGTDKSAGASYADADTFHTFGGPADLWGLTPTVSQVNASDFGVGVQLECTELSDCISPNMRLDTIQVKIYYTTTGGSTADQTWTLGQESTDGKFKISFGHVLGSLTDYFTIASSTGQVSFPYFNATSTTASSTAANGINLTAGCFAIAGTCIGGSGHSAVTLSGALDYITLVGQDIVRGAIDLTTDITGTLPVANGGTGITSFGAGIATWLGTPSIANFFSALTGEGAGVETFLTTPSSTNFFSMVTGETGSGAVVGGTSPTISGLTGTGNYDLSGATVKQHDYIKLTWPGTATTTTATTTLPVGQAMTAELFNFSTCKVTSGTGGYRFTDGTNHANYFPASTTPSRFTQSTNNSFVADEAISFEVGPMTNAQITCGVDVTVN